MRHNHPVERHRCTGVELRQHNQVVIDYAIGESMKNAYSVNTKAEIIRDPASGYAEFDTGLQALDMLNVIETFTRMILNTPLKVYCDKWDGFREHCRILNTARIERETRDLRFNHGFECAEHGTKPKAEVVSHSNQHTLQLVIDVNWVERVKNIGLAYHPQNTPVNLPALQTTFTNLYRRNGFDDPEAMMRVEWVWDRYRIEPFTVWPSRQEWFPVSGYPVSLEANYVIGTPSRGWRGITKSVLEESDRPFNHRVSELVPEQAADMFEDMNEPELARALRLQSGFWTKNTLPA